MSQLVQSTLTCFLLTFIVSQSQAQYSGRSSGVGFVGSYAEVIDKLVDSLRRDGDQKDEFIIHNQLNTINTNGHESPVVEITCEDEEGVTKIILYSGQVYGYLRDRGKFGKDFDLCCQFEWNNRHIPSSHERHYLHLSRVWRGGALRNIYVGSDGIYTDEMLGGLLQNFVAVYREANGGGVSANGRRNWLTGWDQVGSYGVCQKKGDNDYDSEKSTLSPYLLGSSGLKCASVCRMGGGRKSNYWCYTVITSSAQSGGNWDYCSPQYQDTQNYNTVVGTSQSIITSRGLRCSSACVNSSTNGSKYSYFFCSTNDLYSVDGVRKYAWDYCSPRIGYDYYNRQCKSKCDFHGENYKWCWVKGGSWGYC